MRLREAFQARKRIASYLRRTPLVESTWLSRIAGGPVALKLESLQVTSSFKSRGAFNALIARRERQPDRDLRLVTASAGNHGRALAAAAETFSVPLTVFTPAGAPRTKIEAIQRHGAVLKSAPTYEESERQAKAFAATSGADFISAYSDADVIAGAATIALELFEDAPDLDTIVVPVGGGGLIGGVGAAAKAINPACQIVGVEVDASCPFHTSLRAGRLVEIVVGPTLADGLAGNPDPETITFDLIRRFVDRIVTVNETELANAVVGLVESAHLIAEGAGAVGVAALLAGHVRSGGGRIATIVSGSNIDRLRLREILDIRA